MSMMMRRKMMAAASFLLFLHSLVMPLHAFVLNTRQKATRIQKKAPFILHVKQSSSQESSSSSTSNTSNNTNQSNEIPANLRRKVWAKRPPRGHVVPRAARAKQKFGGSRDPKLRPQGQARQESFNNPSNIKIIGGSAKGRRLDSPSQVYLRPMMGKVREAVFSTLTSFGLYDSGSQTRHVDIFAGSGSVGLESKSRGAKYVLFVDLAQDCCTTVEKNIAKCQFSPEETLVVCSDYLVALSQPESVGISTDIPYDILTLSPPYEEVTYAELLEAVISSKLIGKDTIVVIEYPTELKCLPHVVSDNEGKNTMIGVRNRKYGRTVIAMYIVNPSGNLEVANSRPEEFVELK